MREFFTTQVVTTRFVAGLAIVGSFVLGAIVA